MGATVSAFSSLSLDPPLVLVCLTRESRTTAAIRDRKAFAVHLCTSEQATLARRFAADVVEKFAGSNHSYNASGVPCLEDVGLRLECTLHAELDGGDHIIFVGLVQAAPQLNEFEPLIYARRNFFSSGVRANRGLSTNSQRARRPDTGGNPWSQHLAKHRAP